ncbi:carbohydrate ABC transporter permease [Cryobacterium ruanii]|uniref:carbohydrate ABC transporter permease n=1 Tax=Cryobacterium ruanii TaxID=1259197 RepID=UPI001F546E7C|nr:carbohydrate ABC transporter permease [Cryobacterium ruanii]
MRSLRAAPRDQRMSSPHASTTKLTTPSISAVPLYLMMTEAGLRNSFWSLVLPFAFASPYAIFLLREYFRGIPHELIDAARLDGANTLDVLVEIVVPLSRPIIATLTLITIVSHWNSFMWPLVVTTGTEWRVVTVATASLQSQFNGNWTVVMAATTLALVPLLVLFLMFQRSFVRSITIAGSA